jgi:hypothetical protein
MNRDGRRVIIVRTVIVLSIILFCVALLFRVLAEKTDVYVEAARYTFIYWSILALTGVILTGLFIYQYRHLHGNTIEISDSDDRED